MSETVKALLARLAALVPGYSGYADRERRRETDQAVRLAVAARLGAVRAELERKTAEASRAGRFDLLEPLDALARRVATLADSFRHAPAGYAGLFDVAAIGAPELDRLQQLDLEAGEACERLAGEAGAAAHEAGALGRVEEALAAAEEAFRRRASALHEVK